jgi:hypothetical protein
LGCGRYKAGDILQTAAASSPLEHFKEWIARTGLPQELAVALLGVHPIARWWLDASHDYSFWHTTLQEPTFSNTYFKYVYDYVY